MLVTGKPVSIEQAKEIIFRTDSFLTSASEYSGGNAREFNKQYRKDAGLTKLQVTRKYPEGGDYIDSDWRKEQVLQHELGYISTQYVHNTWASSAFIGGPHGWCSPKGVIFYDDNVGKWPSADELVEDWSTLAKEFPFLDLHVTLMSDESGESDSDDKVPVFNIRVVSGVATMLPPDASVHVVRTDGSTKIDQFMARLSNRSHSTELGLPLLWYSEYAERVSQTVDRLFSDEIPEFPTDGQKWYNSTKGMLVVYDGAAALWCDRDTNAV